MGESWRGGWPGLCRYEGGNGSGGAGGGGHGEGLLVDASSCGATYLLIKIDSPVVTT